MLQIAIQPERDLQTLLKHVHGKRAFHGSSFTYHPATKRWWWVNTVAWGQQWNTKWLPSSNEYLKTISSTPPSSDHDTFSFPSKMGHPHHTAWQPDPAFWNEEHKRLLLLCNYEFCLRSSTYEEHVWAPDDLLQFLFAWVVWEVKGKRGGQHRAGTAAGLNLFLR